MTTIIKKLLKAYPVFVLFILIALPFSVQATVFSQMGGQINDLIGRIVTWSPLSQLAAVGSDSLGMALANCAT